LGICIYAEYNYVIVWSHSMHKEELINLHQMLYDVKVYFEGL